MTDNTADAAGVAALFAGAFRDALALARYARVHEGDSVQKILAATDDKGTGSGELEADIRDDLE